MQLNGCPIMTHLQDRKEGNMPKITITIPNRGINGVCGNFNYRETIEKVITEGTPDTPEETETIPNPQTKVQFVEEQFKKLTKDSTFSFESRQAERTTRETLKSEIEAINIT